MSNTQGYPSAHVGNPTIALNSLLDFQTWYENQFSKFMSFTMDGSGGRGTYDFIQNGNKELEGFAPINMHTSELEPGGDYIVVPRLQRLLGQYRIGDQRLAGFEQAHNVMWTQLYVEQVRAAVEIYTGKGSKQKNKRLLDHMIPKKKEDLAYLMAAYVEYHGIQSAFFRGNSKNILDSSDYSISQVSHPNFYYGTASGPTRVSIAALPGTAGYETAVAAANDTYSGAADERIDQDFLLGLKDAAHEHRIPKIITKDGNEFWALVIHPEIGNQIRRLTDFREYQSRAEMMGKANPVFSGALGAYEGFVFYEHANLYALDKLTPGSAYDATTNPLVYGVDDPLNNRDSRTNKLGVLLGANAINGAKPMGVDFDEEVEDYNNRKGLGAAMVCGFSRADYYADANSNVKGALGDFVENDSSLVFLNNSAA